jgi:hypothetical protein
MVSALTDLPFATDSADQRLLRARVTLGARVLRSIIPTAPRRLTVAASATADAAERFAAKPSSRSRLDSTMHALKELATQSDGVCR